MTTNEQLELGFNGLQAAGHGGQKLDRLAAWWFGQMRRIVANAPDWPAGQTPAQPAWQSGAQSK